MVFDPVMFTRREFLKAAAIAGASMTMPAFLTEAVAANSSALKGETDARILVVIQLGGGNDGLNTVVPFADDEYYKLRKNIGVKRDSVLSLNDKVGLHQNMEALKGLYDEGLVGVVQGVGYPNPNRSHFRSMEIWQTAVDSERYSSTGWIGRYFDNCCNGRPDPVAAVNVGSEAPQAFRGKLGTGISFRRPETFGWNPGRLGNNAADFGRLNKTGGTHEEGQSNLDFLRHVTANAVISTAKVSRASAATAKGADYPQNQLANSLKSIGTLIAGGLPTRIYYTSMTGFDTHANQPGAHENLLRNFSEAMAAFQRHLRITGQEDRVMTMCFSEFGRRAKENASRGTDHGTAGPMFLVGRGVKAGLHGETPSLTDLDGGDLKHTTDFRAVYAELLGQWMRADPRAVLEGKFDKVGLLRG